MTQHENESWMERLWAWADENGVDDLAWVDHDAERSYWHGLPRTKDTLTNLNELNLVGNQLTSLPTEIGQLTNLTWLYLNGNPLTSLPPEIRLLTKLKYLYIEKNDFIHEAISNIKRWLPNCKIKGENEQRKITITDWGDDILF